MRRQIDELFGDVWTRAGLAHRGASASARGSTSTTPATPPKAVIKADLAGIDSEDLEHRGAGPDAVISGERKARDAEGRVYQQIEIESGPFQREIQLGVDVDAEEARATYDDGILRVELPLAHAGPDPAGADLHDPPARESDEPTQ